MEHYVEYPASAELYQGDILDRFIIPDPPDESLIVRKILDPGLTTPADGIAGDVVRVTKSDLLPDAFANGREAIIVSATLTKVAIMTQSCDVQRKPFVTVAAVRPMSIISSKEKKEDIRRVDRKLEHFWLPQCTSLEESFVDLTLLFSIRRDILLSFKKSRILSMSPEFRQVFQWSIMQFFGRPAID